MPGRPPLADWLHGIEPWASPEVHVAWREEVEQLQELDVDAIEDVLEDYPLKPHELLRDRADRVLKHIARLSERHGDAKGWIVGPDGAVDASQTLRSIAAMDKEALADCTLLLPPRVGGMSVQDGHPSGMLDGAADAASMHDSLDVADRWDDESGPRRRRIWDDDEIPAGMRLVRVIDTRPQSDDGAEALEEPHRRFWKWYVRPRSADDDGSRLAIREMLLEAHLQRSGEHAEVIVARLGIDRAEASAVTLAARWHDAGKTRIVWQRALGNFAYPDSDPLAKSKKPGPIEINNYRHEFGSLLDVRERAEFQLLPDEARELALHLIAAHHGRARPSFADAESLDPEHPDALCMDAAREVLGRFGRLQRRYGRWGLAYLESLVRAVDALASRAEVSQ
jgi:CRISPR-associated endonuclease/helicase Cas3